MIGRKQCQSSHATHSTAKKSVERLRMRSYPDHVMHAVHITVAHVDSDGAQREPVLLPRAMDGDR